MKLRFRPDALADLREIYDYIADDNPIKAGEFIEAIRKKCRLIAKQPQMGRSRSELHPDLRSFPIKSYVIFYRILIDAVEIVNVIHSARDIRPLFSGNNETNEEQA